MKKISHILSEYFEPDRGSSSRGMLIENRPVPISPNVCNWDIHESPERFSKEFKFQSKNALIDFVSEVLRYESHSLHDGAHNIQGMSVIIDVYTHDINRITELDQEYIKQVDNIYKDVLDFGI